MPIEEEAAVRLETAELLAVLSLCLLAIFPSASIFADEEQPPKLVGRCSAQDLDAEPFAEWYRDGYDGYRPHPEVLERLRRIGVEGLEVSVFFGTWCGDSRREVPRLLKLFDGMGLPAEQVVLVAVDGDDELHKRSPQGEERGLEIYRVPTVVVRRNGEEVNRIVEFPVLSLERDLLAILDGNRYAPNYASYPAVRRWLREGLLADENVSPRGLANEVRHLISGEGELAAAARVLLTRGDVTEAVKLSQVNCWLHRDSAAAYGRLAEAWLQAGDREKARAAAERALRLNTDEEQLGELLELLDRARADAAASSSATVVQ